MTYIEFEELIVNKIKGKLPNEEVIVRSITKNNSVNLRGLVILNEDKRISPSIYLESFFESYKKGQDIDDLVEEILELYNEQDGQVVFDPESYKDINRIRDKVLYKLINFERNEELIENLPHRRFLDFAVVYYVIVDCDSQGTGSILIRNEHLDFWNVNEEDLYSFACANTYKEMPHEIVSMSDIINEILDENNGEYEDIVRDIIPEETDEDENVIKMYVMTNLKRINGAVTMLYEGALKEFANKIVKNLYILPSSVHELVVVPDVCGADKKALYNIVREANEECVSAEEWLSDNVYYYDRNKDEISIVDIDK
ncbi:MAG: hypothetical protein IJW18_02035 [Lachnospiraceae bacterium]|nr:hypothetical protein [Lachnospiraceae bacterium]